MIVEIEEIGQKRLATVRHVGPYHAIAQAFTKLGALAGPAGLIGPTTEMIAMYHDDPEAVPLDQLRSDAGLTVPPDASLPSGLTEAILPAGRYARTVHVGPYTLLGDAWAQLMGVWLPASGHRLGPSVSFEIYRNDPHTTPPEALRTELYLPLA